MKLLTVASELLLLILLKPSAVVQCTPIISQVLEDNDLAGHCWRLLSHQRPGLLPVVILRLLSWALRQPAARQLRAWTPPHDAFGRLHRLLQTEDGSQRDGCLLECAQIVHAIAEHHPSLVTHDPAGAGVYDFVDRALQRLLLFPFMETHVVNTLLRAVLMIAQLSRGVALTLPPRLLGCIGKMCSAVWVSLRRGARVDLPGMYLHVLFPAMELLRNVVARCSIPPDVLHEGARDALIMVSDMGLLHCAEVLRSRASVGTPVLCLALRWTVQALGCCSLLWATTRDAPAPWRLGDLDSEHPPGAEDSPEDLLVRAALAFAVLPLRAVTPGTVVVVLQEVSAECARAVATIMHSSATRRLAACASPLPGLLLEALAEMKDANPGALHYLTRTLHLLLEW